MSLTDLSEFQQQSIQALAADYPGIPFDAEYVGGGRNSRIYRLVGNQSTAYALKVYFQSPNDPRDRLGTEFTSLSFLWQNGIRDIPQPITKCSEAGLALYEFIEGEKIASETLTEDEIDAALHFAARLRALASHPGALTLNAASEANFSIEGIYRNIQQRLNRLIEGQREQKADSDLNEFLENDLLPSMDRISLWSRGRFDWQQELPIGQRTLSPSDFGFHNVIRRDRIVFLDFEYFGWDDPAKLISDFILHPAMNLNHSLARHFARGIVKYFDIALIERLNSVYPLFGLKWCLICLNEFLPEHRLRRQFAAASTRDWDTIRAEQLAKASRILQRINREYDHFPYLD